MDDDNHTPPGLQRRRGRPRIGASQSATTEGRSPRVNVAISPDTDKLLHQIGDARGASRSDIVREALDRYLTVEAHLSHGGHDALLGALAEGIGATPKTFTDWLRGGGLGTSDRRLSRWAAGWSKAGRLQLRTTAYGGQTPERDHQSGRWT